MTGVRINDEQLREALNTLKTCGNYNDAAQKLNLSIGGLQGRVRLAQNRGFGATETPATENFSVTGISTLYGPDGELKAEWVKKSRDAQRAEDVRAAVLEAMQADIPRLAPIPLSVENTFDQLCNLYTLTDCHFGMLAWEKEGGSNWDLKIASKILYGSMENMIIGAPRAKVCVVNQLGDFLHSDGIMPVTPSSGHILDQDGRFSKLASEAVLILRKIVDLALSKHDKVHVVMAEGNHDITSSIWLRSMFALLYENEPRVTVNDSEIPYYVYKHGKIFLGFHHGHKKNNSGLPGFFAAQYRKIWGQTEKGYIHTGHRHHREVKEYPGVIVEQHPTLSSRDAYASRGGYLAERSATCVTYHEIHGEVARNTVTPEMIG